MNTTTITAMLAGGSLVILGVIAGAVASAWADRIRYGKRKPGVVNAPRIARGPADASGGSRDVIAALATAGYKPGVAKQATAAAWRSSNDECESIEGWIRAALREAAELTGARSS